MNTNGKGSIVIVLDNIRVLGKIHNLNTYRRLSQYTSIPISTIGSWYSKNGGKQVCPRLETLDKLCDAFLIHTSELFIPENQFSVESKGKNDSMRCFRANLSQLSTDNALARPKDRIKTLFDNDSNRYYSYMRKNKGRSIPIPEIDYLANKLDTTTYELLKPIKEVI